MKSTIVALFFIFISSNIYAASFDCKKATTFVEKSICSDNKLSELDNILSELYKKTLLNSTDKVEFKTQQKMWLKNVRDKCQDSDCLKDVYRDRISKIETILVWNGEWKRANSNKYDYANLTIKNENSKKFDFEFFAISGANFGELKGVANIAKQNAIGIEYNSDCKVEFILDNKCIAVSTKENCSPLGNGAYIDEKYCRAGALSKVESPIFPVFGILNDENELSLFKKLVGPKFELFDNSFQMIVDEIDLDGLNAIVVSGGVRGLYTINEGIIMKYNNDKFLASIIDEEAVIIFTNDTRFVNKIPLTIEKWREGFADRKIIFKN